MHGGIKHSLYITGNISTSNTESPSINKSITMKLVNTLSTAIVGCMAFSVLLLDAFLYQKTTHVLVSCHTHFFLQTFLRMQKSFKESFAQSLLHYQQMNHVEDFSVHSPVSWDFHPAIM